MAAHILIVDDEENLAYFLQQNLIKSGFVAEKAHSLSQAREKIDNFFPDVLLLDMSLPDGNGIDFYKQLKQADITIPTIIITAHGTIQSAINAIKLGVDDYIVKPFDMKELLVNLDSLDQKYHLKNQLKYYRRKAKCVWP